MTEPHMKHYGRTPEEQLEKNKPAMELLKRWIEEANTEQITEEEKIQRERAWELFKQIIDNERPPGHKLYSEEE